MYRIAASLLILLGVAACASEPPPPLMSPLAEARHYGYTEKPLGGSTWQVRYVGPQIPTSRNRAAREVDSDAVKAQARDLALWRAAQLTLDRGHPVFRVVDEEIETEVLTTRDYYSGYGYYPYYHPYPFHGPFYWPGYYGYPRSFESYSQTTVRGVATLTIAMQETAGPDTVDAAATVERLRGAWPRAAAPESP